jgi:hypothetical protein
MNVEIVKIPQNKILEIKEENKHNAQLRVRRRYWGNIARLVYQD